MRDRITIKDLLVRAIVGINDDERVNRQDVLINISMWTDVRDAAASDSIDDAVNYRSVTKQIIEHVEESQCFLVERLVQEIADLCLVDRRVHKVEVSVEKPTALRFARSVGVVVCREREDG